jgi:hypothetical protein
VVYRKGEMTKAQIDREWPHQVALSAQFVRGHNHTIIDRFCRGLSVCPRHHYYERNGERYVVYCFADRAEAEFFQMQFDGTLMDPTTRPRCPDHRQSAPSAEERHRNGRCVNCDD